MSVEAVLGQYAGQGFGAFKPALAELLVETLRPIRDRFVALKSDDSAIDAILAKGAGKATALSKPTVEAAYQALGLLR
jgi:tryptophanyl-tRNA synthetase